MAAPRSHTTDPLSLFLLVVSSLCPCPPATPLNHRETSVLLSTPTMVLLASPPGWPPSLKDSPITTRNLKDRHSSPWCFQFSGLPKLLGKILLQNLARPSRSAPTWVSYASLSGSLLLSPIGTPPPYHFVSPPTSYFFTAKLPGWLLPVSLTHIHRAGQAWLCQHLNLPSHRPSLLGLKMPKSPFLSLHRMHIQPRRRPRLPCSPGKAHAFAFICFCFLFCFV